MGSRLSKAKPPSYQSIEEDWPWVWVIKNPEYLDWKRGLSEDEILACATRQRDLPVPITDNVYLGNAASVESIFALQALGITAVLNMAAPVALRNSTIKALKGNGIQYKGIRAEDEWDYELLRKHWEEALEFIESSTKDGGKCIVNCAAGLNRSVIIVSAYYMTNRRKSVLESVRHVRERRGNLALCNEGFQQQIVAMARENDLLGPAPGTEGSVVQEKPPPAMEGWPVDWEETVTHGPGSHALDALDRLAGPTP